MKATKIMAVVTFVLLAMPLAMADYAYSPVVVTVTTSTSFTVTLNAQGATASDPTHAGTATEIMWFNSTDGQSKYVNATVIGADDQVGTFPACETPIAVFKNTGTTTIDLSVTLNNTVTGMVFFYNASNTTGSDTGTADGEITAFTTTASTFVTGLGLNNQTDVCFWTNFTSVPAGVFGTAFNYTSIVEA